MDADKPDGLLAGRYRLEHRLGRGGMGEVWAAHDNVLDRAVAVKLLRDDRATQDPTLRARFVSEARSSARFHHPNVVDVFDAGADEDAFYLVMERLPGKSLGHQILQERLTADEARAMSADVLAGLGAAHAAQLVHRDIKPPNILQTEDGRWKLVDFGIAKSLDATDNLTATGITIGSPSYLAPEQIQGEAATPLCDIWAMGVVLYESLAGHKPFRGDTPYALAEAVCTTEPTPLGTIRPDLDPGLLGVINRALSKPPERRFQSAAAMADALRGRSAAPDADATSLMAASEATRVAPAMPSAFAGAGAGGLQPTPPPLPPSPPPSGAAAPRRRSRWPWVVGALLLIGVLAAAAMAAAGDGDGDGDTTTTLSTDPVPTAPVDDSASSTTASTTTPTTAKPPPATKPKPTTTSTTEAPPDTTATTQPPDDTTTPPPAPGDDGEGKDKGEGGKDKDKGKGKGNG